MSPPLPTPRTPRLAAELPLAGAGGAPPVLEPEALIELQSLDGADLGAAVAPGVALRGVRLLSTRFADAALESLELTDAELSGCDLANLRAPRATWRRVAARSCRMTGLVLTEARLRDVTLRDCRVDLATFAGARLERVGFERCELWQSDFLEAELDGVSFTDCDMRGADLRGARLRRCELRGCRLHEVQGVERLRGAALPWPDIVGNAALWAAALGIVVLDDVD